MVKIRGSDTIPTENQRQQDTRITARRHTVPVLLAGWFGMGQEILLCGNGKRRRMDALQGIMRTLLYTLAALLLLAVIDRIRYQYWYHFGRLRTDGYHVTVRGRCETV